MISNEVRKAALAVVTLSKDQIRQALQIGRALAKIAPAHRPAALRAAKLLGGEVTTRKRKAKDGEATPVNGDAKPKRTVRTVKTEAVVTQ